MLDNSRENFSKDNAIQETTEVPHNPSIQKESQKVRKNNSLTGATEVAFGTDNKSNEFKDIGTHVNSFSHCGYSHHNDKYQTYTIDDDDLNKNNNYQKLLTQNYLKHNDVLEISDKEEFSEDKVETRSNPPTLVDENTITWNDAENFGNYTQINLNYVEEIISSQTYSIQHLDTAPCKYLTHEGNNTDLNWFQCAEYIITIPGLPTPSQTNTVQSVPTPLIHQTNSHQGIPIRDTLPSEALANQNNTTDLNTFQSSKYKKKKYSKKPSNLFIAVQCLICGRQIASKENMKTHLSRFHKIPLQELETHQNLDNYYHQLSQSNGKKAQKILNCEMCNKKTKSTKAMEKHYQLYHRPNIHTQQCEICHTRILNKGFESHMKIHLSKKIICKYCGRLLKDKCHLRGHINTDHPETNSSPVSVYPKQFRKDLSSYGRINNTYSINKEGHWLNFPFTSNSKMHLSTSSSN